MYYSRLFCCRLGNSRFQNEIEIMSYNYKQIILGYGPAKRYSVGTDYNLFSAYLCSTAGFHEHSAQCCEGHSVAHSCGL